MASFWTILCIFLSFSFCLTTASLSEVPKKHCEVRSNAFTQILRRKILKNYDSGAIPDNVNLKMGFTIISAEIDKINHKIEMEMWKTLEWNDNRVTWDESKFGCKSLVFKTSELWTPDIELYNYGFNIKEEDCKDTGIVAKSNGTLTYIPPCTIKLASDLWEKPASEIESFKLNFGSWVYDGKLMNLNLKSKEVDISSFTSNSLEITNTTLERNEKVYSCCSEPYFDIKVYLSLKKKEEKQAGKVSENDGENAENVIED